MGRWMVERGCGWGCRAAWVAGHTVAHQMLLATAATCPCPSRRRTQFTGFSATEVAAIYDDAFAALHREHARRAREGGCSVLWGG